jgi:hypothetical protein
LAVIDVERRLILAQYERRAPLKPPSSALI